MENFVLYDSICNFDDQTIFKARRKGTINFLAISCIEKKKRTHVTNHVRFARSLDHELILKFYDWYETSNHLWLVMDLCTGGTLERMLREDKSFPEQAISEIGRQLVLGLQFLHSSGVIFADWYPTRIFLDGRGNVKFFDFSYARMEAERSENIFLTDGIGTLEFDGLSPSALPYMAPEIISGFCASKASDVWGLGCILFKMFFGLTPFFSQVPAHLKQMICSHELEIPLGCKGEPSNDLWNLLCGMLNKDIKTRFTLRDILNHRFWQTFPRPNSEDVESPIHEKLKNSKRSSIVRMASIASDIDSKLDILATSKDKPYNESKSESKLLKRSVSMGDNALASAALLRKKNIARKDSQKSGKRAEKNPEIRNDSFTGNHSSSRSISINLQTGNPVGAANFTLHAQACPVPMRPSTFDASNIAKGSPNTSSDDISIDTSSRSNSKTVDTPNRYGKNAFFDSNDNIHSLATEERMTKSEYIFRNSDASGRLNSAPINQLFPVEEKIAFLISPQTRARVALIYPWGDDSSSLPQGTALSDPCISCEHEVLSRCNELGEFNKETPKHESTYLPQALGDYDKLMQAPLKSGPCLPEGLPVLSPSTIGSLDSGEITDYASKLLTKMMDRMTFQDPKNRPSTFLSYVAWFLAMTTQESCRSDLYNLSVVISISDIIAIIGQFVSAAATLLKFDAVSSIVKTWLCRIIGLLIHRTTCMIQCDHGGDAERAQHVNCLITQITPDLPCLAATIVDVLKEPAYKSVFLLKQASIYALGEVVNCELCIYCKILLDPTAYNEITSEGFDVTKSEWQAILHRITRSLTLTNTRSTNTPRSAVSNAPKRPLVRMNSSASTTFTRSVSSTGVNEDDFRLAAARVLNEIIVVLLGCRLVELLQQLDVQNLDRKHAGVRAAITLSGSLNVFLDCLLTPEIVSRVWSDGIVGGSGAAFATTEPKKTVQVNLVAQQVAHASASALAGLIRLRPSLFMCGLIDRNGTTAFMNKLNPSSGMKEGQTTIFLANLLSATTTGLLLPLAFQSQPLGASLLRVGMKSGTPVACRRLLTNPRLLTCVLRQLQSPHVMLRAKAYLLVAAALDTSVGGAASVSSSASGDTLIASCDARLPSCLERDLRLTNQHYVPTRTSSGVDEDVTTDGVLIPVNETQQSTPGFSSNMSPSLHYLGVCAKHLSDLLIHSLIPNICKQVAMAIGAYGSTKLTAGARVKMATSKALLSGMTSSTYQERSKRTTSSAYRSPLTHVTSGASGTRSSATSSNLKSCLPAYSCLPGILASSASVRNYLLLPPRPGGSNGSAMAPVETNPTVPGGERFCIIDFLTRIIDHSASSMGTLTSVHQQHSTSMEYQLLQVTLALVEDMSRQLEVVEGRRADLIRLLLPAIARLAVAPFSDSITRTICVKIILDMKNIWSGGATGGGYCGSDTDSLTSSNISLNLPNSPSILCSGLSRSPLSGERLNTKPVSVTTGINNFSGGRTSSMQSINNKIPASSTTMVSPHSSSRASSRPSSFYGRSSSGISSLRAYRHTSNLKNNIQGPTPEVLMAVGEIVNNLLIPYVPRLLDLRDTDTASYFLRLIIDCLHPPPSSSDDYPPSVRGHQPLITSLRASKFLKRLLAFITSCDSTPHRFSIHCLLAVRLVTLFASDWPYESGLVQMLTKPPDGIFLNPAAATYCLLLSSSRALLRHERIDSGDARKVSTKTLAALNISAGRSGVKHVFALLELLNALLNLVTDVVRFALNRGQGNDPTNTQMQRSRNNSNSIIDHLPRGQEEVCAIAEKLLSSARPPEHLAGILASFLEASSHMTTSSDSLVCHVLPHSANLATALTSLATGALACLASLYGGEHCRSALSPAGMRGFAIAFVSPGSNTVTRQKDRRLLLRILRRLAESDAEVCLVRMASPEGKLLQTALHSLAASGQEGSGEYDAVTLRLARSLCEQLEACQKQERQQKRKKVFV